MRSPLLAPIGLLPLLVACSAYDMAGKASDEGGYYDTGASGAPSDDGDFDGGDGGDSGDLGSEEPDDFLALRPATTDAYVFVANPNRDTVTRISVPSLAVITTQVGVNPQAVATTDDYTMAVTFNQGSDDVSIIDAETLAVRTVEVRDNFNAMRMSADGEWVVCYHDTAVQTEGGGGGAQSYNEVSFVRLADGAHFPMVVGFNPRSVQFTEDGRLAVVVSDSYLAIVDLTEETPSPVRVQIAQDLLDPPEAEEVLLTPAGDYAMVRQYGVSELVVVDLATTAVERVPVGAGPTDLDATPDGTQAVAVAREASELWVYDLSDPFAAAEVIPLPEGEIFGSVLMSPDGSKALLYSTASGRARYGAWDRAAADPSAAVTVHSLVKPVDGMAVSPDGGVALVFHHRSENGDLDETSPFYNAYALTLVDLGDFFANPLRLPSEPTSFAHTDDGETGFFIMEGEPYLEVLDYSTLLYEEVPLKSDPVHLGVLPETRTAYVSQEHELGRISFYDTDAASLQTITGFELNSGIDH